MPPVLSTPARSAVRQVLRLSVEPLGEWRTRLIWRGFGVFINQLGVMVTFMLGWPPFSFPAYCQWLFSALPRVAAHPRGNGDSRILRRGLERLAARGFEQAVSR